MHKISTSQLLLSRQRESNPPPQLGKLIYYRCTMSAHNEITTNYYSKTKKDCNRFFGGVN
mgnify:FL=1